MTVTSIDRPRLRVLPLPSAEPAPGRPHRPAPPVVGALALSLSSTEEPRLEDHQFGPQHTPTHALPDPRQTSTFLFQAVVEVLGGRRPVSQLTRWMTHEVHAGLSIRAATIARVLGQRPNGRSAVVKAVRICRPADGVVEASATVIDTHRVRAVAMRLEGLDGRWRVTALEVG